MAVSLIAKEYVVSREGFELAMPRPAPIQARKITAAC